MRVTCKKKVTLDIAGHTLVAIYNKHPPPPLSLLAPSFPIYSSTPQPFPTLRIGSVVALHPSTQHCPGLSYTLHKEEEVEEVRELEKNKEEPGMNTCKERKVGEKKRKKEEEDKIKNRVEDKQWKDMEKIVMAEKDKAKHKECEVNRKKDTFPQFCMEISSEEITGKLRIPLASNSFIESESLGVISLKGPSGNIWKAKLVLDSDGLCFVNGWKEFFIDHHIEFGDFLVFRYDGHSQFSVSVFDTTECEKQLAFHACPGHLQGNGRTMGCAKITANDIKKAKGRIDEADPTSSLPRLKERKRELAYIISLLESSKSLRKTKETRASRLNSMKGSSSTILGRSDEVPSSGKFVTPMARKINKMKTVPRQGKAVAKVPEPKVFVSQRLVISEKGKENTLKRETMLNSNYPFTLQIMKACHVSRSSFMDIPSEFVNNYLPKVNAKMTLWDQQGRPWEVNYVYHESHGAFRPGWGAFVIGNNIEKDDICLFELFQENNFKVGVFGVVQETFPCIPMLK